MINGSILGVGIQNSSGNEEINQDGLKIKLDKELNSEYNIRVVAFRDSNQNYKFDQNKDLPCIKENGELVQADMKVDFSKYN
ncbi:hypothetical protein SAMN05216388_100936 [Halorientalis persicus]|uniref:Uncharacterized protein n=2 Tax=Halorientalis persicus TaxID=1367881 RepID=A0A1H8MKV7_9EURY|nr:hypothetical protein SAMN05216388_100936 [Halorientalis persicus]